MIRAAIRLLLRTAPLALVAVVLMVLSGEGGSYESSWRAIRWFFDTVSPQRRTGVDWAISMYQINDTVRKLAHVLLYAGVVWTGASLLPGNRAQHPWRRIAVGIGVAAMLGGADTAVRLLSETRHVRWEQLLWNSGGVAIASVLWILRQGIDHVTRWAENPTDFNDSNPDPATIADSTQPGGDNARSDANTPPQP